MSEPVETRHQVGAAELALFEWPGHEPAAFFIHATGFHARCWDQVVARLGGRRAFSIDVRGHGRSTKTDPPYDWTELSKEVGTVIERIGLQGAVGVGHSMGGYLVTMAAARTGAFGALCLVDPVIQARNRPAPPANPTPPSEHFVARRRNEFPSPEAMFEGFKTRSPYNSWDPKVLHDYCQYGLLPNPAGEGYVLACPGIVEAAVYGGAAMAADPYAAIAGLDIPVRVIRARQRPEGAAQDMTNSPTVPDAAQAFPHGEDLFVPQYSHFIPMEDPAFVAAQVEEMAAKAKAAG